MDGANSVDVAGAGPGGPWPGFDHPQLGLGCIQVAAGCRCLHLGPGSSSPTQVENTAPTSELLIRLVRDFLFVIPEILLESLLFRNPEILP